MAFSAIDHDAGVRGTVLGVSVTSGGCNAVWRSGPLGNTFRWPKKVNFHFIQSADSAHSLHQRKRHRCKWCSDVPAQTAATYQTATRWLPWLPVPLPSAHWSGRRCTRHSLGGVREVGRPQQSARVPTVMSLRQTHSCCYERVITLAIHNSLELWGIARHFFP
jgi:hypothetical protein